MGFKVCFMTQDGVKGYLASQATNIPVLFPTEDEAWAYIQEVMNAETHPRFMWIQETEVQHANP